MDISLIEEMSHEDGFAAPGVAGADAGGAGAGAAIVAKSDNMSVDTTAEDSATTSSPASARAATESETLSKDNRAVYWSRLLVFVVLAVAAAALGYLTYYYVQQEELEDFRNEFADFADEIIDISQQNVKKVFGVLDGLSVAATSHALYSNSTFPFLTIPNFAQRGSTARTNSQALIIAYLPLVSEVNREPWEQYSLQHQDWIQHSYPSEVQVQPIRDQIHAYGPKEEETTKAPTQEETLAPPEDGSTRRRRLSAEGSRDAEANEGHHRFLKERHPEPPNTGPYAPVWQMNPTPPANDTSIINYNLFDKPVYKKAISFIDYTRKPAFLDVCDQAAWFGGHFSNKNVLQTAVVQPVFDSFEADDSARLVGSLVAIIPWASFFENIVHARAPELRVVLSNTCDEVFTFSIMGHDAIFLEEEDLHDPTFDDMGVHSAFVEFANSQELLEADLGEHCVYTVHVYPTKEHRNSHLTKNPTRYCLVVLAVFIFTSIIFLLYDGLVRRRQMRLVQASAQQHEQLVSSLFPANVRDRVFHARQEMANLQQPNNSCRRGSSNGNCNNSLVDSPMDFFSSKPIADLFATSTVMFADIAGFTAWASVRSPEEVFNLLEVMYHGFDQIANREGVFKVETIGDSYVAVAGVPLARADHAVVMARFARSCMNSFTRNTRKLEVSLGPSTATLRLRIGLHSGPVTGGVLRGAKARFQLFGDTVNTAARMESTGLANKIQVSRETADLLRECGKESYLEPRTDLVLAKGKGCMETYWLKLKHQPRYSESIIDTTSNGESTAFIASEVFDISDELKLQKLVNWNCSMLLPHLKSIVAKRQINKPTATPPKKLRAMEFELSKKYLVKDQIREIIDFPEYVAGTPEVDPRTIDLGVEVEEQLRRYVSLVAELYEDNPFHCFEHASHVTMSTSKMLARIVNLNSNQPQHISSSSSPTSMHHHMINQTFGISDPLTQFSIILSALLHDSNHVGIPNNTLAREDPALANAYSGKSVAEQNSVDVAWTALMRPEFDALRNCIYCNEEELRRFRQIVVNSIMATDIFDAELSALRKKRWNRVFKEEKDQLVFNEADEDDPPEAQKQMSQEHINRKATLVLEHLIQASDVAHTMQHWQVYLEWNARLFEEMYIAYRLGRTDKDPSEGDSWYKGEIWFFDNYVIPLAKKLKECGVFGVSSAEYLDYALKNRREWESRGDQVVAEMVTNISKSFDLEQARAKEKARLELQVRDRRQSRDKSLTAVVEGILVAEFDV